MYCNESSLLCFISQCRDSRRYFVISSNKCDSWICTLDDLCGSTTCKSYIGTTTRHWDSISFSSILAIQIDHQPLMVGFNRIANSFCACPLSCIHVVNWSTFIGFIRLFIWNIEQLQLNARPEYRRKSPSRICIDSVRFHCVSRCCGCDDSDHSITSAGCRYFCNNSHDSIQV